MGQLMLASFSSVLSRSRAVGPPRGRRLRRAALRPDRLRRWASSSWLHSPASCRAHGPQALRGGGACAGPPCGLDRFAVGGQGCRIAMCVPRHWRHALFCRFLRFAAGSDGQCWRCCAHAPLRQGARAWLARGAYVCSGFVFSNRAAISAQTASALASTQKWPVAGSSMSLQPGIMRASAWAAGIGTM